MFSRCLSLDLSIDSLLDRKPPDPCGASIAPARYRLLSSLAAIVPKGTCRAYLVRGYHLVLAQRSTRTLPRALRLSFERKLFFRWKCSCSPSNASRSDRTSSIPPHIARHFLAAVDVTPIASSKNSTEGRFRSASNSKCDQPPNRRSSATFENYSWLFGIQFDSLGRWSCLIAARPFDQPDFTNLHIEILRLCLESMPPLWPLDCESKIHASLPITPRQREVVRCLLKGLPRKQIAASLGISVFTVNDHIKAIYEKLSVRSIGELASKFLDNQVPRTSPVLSESWIGPAPRN